MSKHRIKAVALEDDYDGYDEEYAEGADNPLTAEDKEQLSAGTVAVRGELGTAFPVTDQQIQDSLWHYFYDIAKTVAYLQKQQSAAAPKAKKKQDQTLAVATHCPQHFDAKAFFEDTPWLDFPPSRRAHIACEVLPRPRGLLGGSAKSEKMSKLAALAAKRRQKENTRPVQADESGPAATNDYASSLKALRLSSATPVERKVSEIYSEVNTAPTQKPAANHLETNPKKQSTIDTLHPFKPELQFKLEDVMARPSEFAKTMFGAAPRARSLNLVLPIQVPLQGGHYPAFDFTTPSPDDLVTRAQAAKVNSAAKSGTKEPKKPKTDLSNSVNNLSIYEPVKIKHKNIDVIAEHGKIKRKNAANFVVIGHVDAGKSTLMGRLLFDLKAIDQRTIDKYKREAENIGKGSFAFAWVLDQGSEERARGVTIDIATNNFETEKTKFTILDAPGHRDFVPNMIAGASQADFAVLVIDASTGNFESGLKGQTKEHALLARSIGVQRLIVAVNKMDAVNWSEERFAEIQQQMSGFLTSAGFQPKNVAFVPCSGLQGNNILNKNTETTASWYHGLSLAEELDNSEPNTHSLDKPLRLTIGDVFRGGVQNPLSVSGRLEAGTVQIGEHVIVMPSGEKAYIKSLEVDDEPQEWAVAGQNVVINLTDIDAMHLKTGDVVCSTVSPIQNVTQFTAKILAFDHLTPMTVDIHRGRLNIPGRISQLVATLDKASGAVIKKKPKMVQPGSVVRIVVTLEQAVPLESPGRIVLRNGGETVGAGLVEKT